MTRFFVVAECGVTWNGDLDLAFEMIRQSAKAKADAVKFQLFRRGQILESPHYELLKKMCLSKDDCVKLKEVADSHNIEFFASTMYLDAVDILKEIGCKKVKIRFKDHDFEPLVNKAVDSGMEVFISTDKRPSDPFLRYHPKIKWLYCLPFYPPQIEQFQLDYAKTFDGISCHFPHNVCALAYAACTIVENPIIEKHVMFDSWSDLSTTPIDWAASVTMSQLKQLVNDLRLIEQMPRGL